MDFFIEEEFRVFIFFVVVGSLGDFFFDKFCGKFIKSYFVES